MTPSAADLEDAIAAIDLPIKEIAAMTGMTRSTLSRMRHGKQEITARTLLHLAALSRLSKGQRNEIQKLARALQGERVPWEKQE
jgi:transcriptional regulator with XRE-family HTH domain